MTNTVTAFPPEPPTDLTSANQIVDNDWAAFSRLDTLGDHWARPGWPDGQRAYYWFLHFGQDTAVRGLARQCIPGFTRLGFDPVALDRLHLTVLRISDGRLARQSLCAIVRAGREVCRRIAPVRLRIGPLAGSTGAIRFSVAPWHQLEDLHVHLRNATTAALGEVVPESGAGFRPHVSIAYGNRVRPASPVIRAVVPLRGLRPVETVVDEVHLVDLRRHGRSYIWQTEAVLPLAGS